MEILQIRPWQTTPVGTGSKYVTVQKIEIKIQKYDPLKKGNGKGKSMLKSSLKKVVASLAVLFSGLMLFSQEPITGKGSFTVQCGKYEILLNMDNKFTMNKLIYEGYEVVPVGAISMVLAREAGTYIGGPHTEGGEEKIGKVEFYVDDKKLEPENKGKYDVKSFVMKKTSLLDNLRLESTFILNQDGIIEQRQFEALDDQNVALLYLFCYCFNCSTKEWMASLADGKTVAGVFADNKAFLIREDAKYLAEYDPASQKGMIVFFPEVIPGKGHKSTFWDVGSVYHKYYLMMDVPSVIKKGFKSKLMTIMLKGFSAVAQDWKPTVEKNIEKMSPPALAVQRDGSNVQISWPGAEEGWRLESSAEPSGAAWDLIAQNPTPVGGRWTVSLTEPTGRRFYRLVKP